VKFEIGEGSTEKTPIINDVIRLCISENFKLELLEKLE
jgi:hypothetical protein